MTKPQFWMKVWVECEGCDGKGCLPDVDLGMPTFHVDTMCHICDGTGKIPKFITPAEFMQEAYSATDGTRYYGVTGNPNTLENLDLTQPEEK